MPNFDINITKISNDKKSCIDSQSRIYTLNDVIKNSKNMNVHVVTCRGIQYIRYKKNCKNSLVKVNCNYECEPMLIGSFGTIYDIHVIFEDASSANIIMIGCIAKFAEVNKIRLNCHIIRAKGVENIPSCIHKYANEIKHCIIVYDELTQDTKVKTSIDNEIKFAKNQFNNRIVVFKPRCIEECALSFKFLTDEIVNTTDRNKMINNIVNDYFVNNKDYIDYDPITNQYNFAGNPIHFGYYSKYLKENVTNIERFLADMLAQITFDNPYEFIKRANECWYKNCMTDNGYCILANILGTKRPNSKVNRCNKLLLREDKIKTVIINSLFAGFYDALQIIFGINTLIMNPNTLKEVITCYI